MMKGECTERTRYTYVTPGVLAICMTHRAWMGRRPAMGQYCAAVGCVLQGGGWGQQVHRASSGVHVRVLERCFAGMIGGHVADAHPCHDHRTAAAISSRCSVVLRVSLYTILSASSHNDRARISCSDRSTEPPPTTNSLRRAVPAQPLPSAAGPAGLGCTVSACTTRASPTKHLNHGPTRRRMPPKVGRDRCQHGPSATS